jgi:hypothetical protein
VVGDAGPLLSALDPERRTTATRAESSTAAASIGAGTTPDPSGSGPPRPGAPGGPQRPTPHEEPALLGATSGGASQLHQENDRSVPATVTPLPCPGATAYQRLHVEQERYVTAELDDRTARPG